MTADALSALFARVLEVPAVGADADFFDLGGDSLSATRVLSAIHRETGAELDFADIWQAATPALLADRIASARR